MVLDMQTAAENVKHSTRIVDLVPGLKHSGAYWIGPCPFCGGVDRFNVKAADDGDLWVCRQCAPDKYHDVIDFLERRDGLTFAQVVGQAGQMTAARPSGPHPATSARPSPDLAQPPAEQWQADALAAAVRCADYLRGDSAGARAAMRHLHEVRKLTRSTLDAATIGYNPKARNLAAGYLPRGFTIPGTADGELWYLKVRIPPADEERHKARALAEGRKSIKKYPLLPGSKPAMLFNADRLVGAAAVFVVEGEFDALLLGQYLPPGVCAVTMGSAGTMPGVTWLRYLRPCATSCCCWMMTTPAVWLWPGGRRCCQGRGRCACRMGPKT